MKITHCTECAKPYKKESATKYICPDGHIFWNNPKGASCVILLQGEQAYFAKRDVAPHKGKYDFPGGFLEYGEGAYEAARRELSEETGLKIGHLDLISTVDAHQYEENVTVCDFIFVCTDWTGKPAAADDVAALELKPIDFIDSEDFAWDYAGVSDKVKKYIHDRSTKN